MLLLSNLVVGWDVNIKVTLYRGAVGMPNALSFQPECADKPAIIGLMHDLPTW